MAPREHFRSTVRYGIDLPASIRDAPAFLARDARLMDVSLAGARVEVLGGLDSGARVQFELKTPTLWDPLVIDAVVAWSRPTGAPMHTEAGLKFIHRSPAAVSALFDLLGTQEFETG